MSQLQPFIAVFPQACMGQFAPFWADTFLAPATSIALFTPLEPELLCAAHKQVGIRVDVISRCPVYTVYCALNFVWMCTAYCVLVWMFTGTIGLYRAVKDCEVTGLWSDFTAHACAQGVRILDWSNFVAGGVNRRGR